jgi:hypothetical protein
MAQQVSIASFTKGMESQKGYFDLFYQAETGKVFIQMNTFGEQFLFQSSLPQGIGSNDIGLDRGQLGETRLVAFERFGKNVLLKQLNTQFRVTSGNLAEQASIDEAFADSVIAGLPIVAQTKDQVLVDYTDFLLSDIHQIGDRLAGRQQGKYKVDPNRSGVFLKRTKAFPENTELEALVTYAGSEPGEYVKQVTPAPKSISVHLHHSLIKLPDDQYQTRQFHPYSGFWSAGFQDYSVAIEDSMNKRFIPRHRLHKKDPYAQRSEAISPIIYYLDPGIPEPIMSALQDGALWWDQAFSEIGYDNAFQVKILPEDADPMDVRYNVIQWVHRATRGWSYGSSVIDPRTGEILKGHVTLGSLRVRQDYLIALGLTSPFDSDSASTKKQRDMALARIRQLSAHEVGHTLGIAHNFSASENQLASVMDYPHPNITIKNNKIVLDDAYGVGIGEWDKHVIAYGYQDIMDKDQEAVFLAKQIAETRAKGLLYMSDPDSRSIKNANPSGHLWDLGSDPVAKLNEMIEIRALALSKFGINTLKTGLSLSSLQETLAPIYLLPRYQMQAAVKLIGGVAYEYELKGDYQTPKGRKIVDTSAQKQALEAILQTLTVDYLSLPESLLSMITPKAYGESNSRESFKGRTGVTFDSITAAESSAAYSLSLLLNPERLNRLSSQYQYDDSQLSVKMMMSQLLSQLIKVNKKQSEHPLQARLAFVALDATVNAMQHPLLGAEVRSEIHFELIQLNQWLKNNTRNSHNLIMGRQLDHYLKTGEWQGSIDVKPLPPGSPI